MSTEIKVKPEIKKMWIEALTSGEYLQGQGCLRSDNNFCCLGVLEDLFIKNTGKAKWRDAGNKINGKFEVEDDNGDFDALYLLDSTRSWAFDYDDLEAFIEIVENDLIIKNDNGVSFEDIALYIKKEL